MKRFIFSLFFVYLFAINCFASDYKISDEFQDKYRNEINKTIKYDIPRTKNNINKEFLRAKNVYNKYLKNKTNPKNLDKYIFEIEDYQRGIEAYEVMFLSKLIDITDKYKNIKELIPPTAFSGTLIDFIYPYFEVNNIDFKPVEDLSKHTANKLKEIDILLQNK